MLFSGPLRSRRLGNKNRAVFSAMAVLSHLKRERERVVNVTAAICHDSRSLCVLSLSLSLELSNCQTNGDCRVGPNLKFEIRDLKRCYRHPPPHIYEYKHTLKQALNLFPGGICENFHQSLRKWQIELKIVLCYSCHSLPINLHNQV